MKTVLLMRHAKSEQGSPGLEDYKRPLNKRGRAVAPMMGKFLRKQGLTPGIVLSSSAERARQTADAVVAGGKFDMPVTVLQELYLATSEAYIDQLALLPNTVDCPLLVGHNPGLEDLLERLTGVSEFLPTAAVAHVELPVMHWENLHDSPFGTLESVWRPKELAAE